ncbi:hypothetical protein M6D81_11995 [Paenibacillus sp. J5C_2022]|uniref:hypothetical protein n=1 Tax=Paenibacillus sp. J5C2022 TaxID=2977129 RepID=UPI0021D1E032|nr:hypothetical protein [Paenibacillus sp. J5C2022]MCU6709427.1 hypothetical protein [Paenibacillus sp. J5C2022]
MEETVKEVQQAHSNITIVKGIGIVREHAVLDIEGLFKKILEIHNRYGTKTKNKEN